MVKKQEKTQVLSYAETIRLRMKTADNPTGEVLTIRETARRLGYSYEHVRKVYNGDPVVSIEFNEAICGLLGLDKDKMWRMAQLEKLQQRFGVPESDLLPPKNKKFEAVWEQLTSDDHRELLVIAEGMLLARRAKEARERLART